MLNYIIFIIGCVFCFITRRLATNFCKSYHPNEPDFCYAIGIIFSSLLTFFYWVVMVQFHFYSI